MNVSHEPSLLTSVSNVIGEFRALADTMPSQQLAIFLAVAERPGIRQSELRALVGSTAASISRNLDALSRTNRHSKTGLGLLFRQPIGRGQRSPKLALTQRGQDLARRIATSHSNQPKEPFNGIHWEVWV